ncbi:hypothetical protein [Candidatus Lokiarchaeum ossiferum]|uniref:hypothetical protein n=1 Tax=Candidatus Lokiarchaeum ossiferum TaxID=2951803 RepID=UPI00352D628C
MLLLHPRWHVFRGVYSEDRRNGDVGINDVVSSVNTVSCYKSVLSYLVGDN